MRRILTNRFIELFGIVFLALMLLMLSGSSGEGQTSLLGSWMQSYVEETATAFDATTHQSSGSQLADISSIYAGTGGDSASSPAPSTDAATINESAILAPMPPDSNFLDGFKASQVINYSVQQNDTIGSIAEYFGVTVDTIIWANTNTLKDPNALSVGQVLKIPPVSGIIYTVQTGDTVALIAKQYNADPSKILAFNKLQDDQVLIIGTELIVPGGELPGPKPSMKPAARNAGGFGIYKPVGDGQCVAFVRAHGYPDLHGNAYLWANYINTLIPVPGGVVVFRGGRYGHVALITAVEANSIQIVEQNYYGLYVIDHREVSLGDGSIKGFIR